MRLRDLIFISLILAGGLVLLRGAMRPSVAGPRREPLPWTGHPDIATAVGQLDSVFHKEWTEKRLPPAPLASELAIIRRLSLALTGSIPSLQEVRRIQKYPEGERVDRWLDDLLRDRRTADFLAERFARVLVGTEDGPFVQFRRRRFTTWLSDEILANRPYDAIVRDLVADQGLWTDHPATNFVSVTFSEEAQSPDPERLASRVSRAFLGVRLDCAHCHDHPFQPWKQDDFQGLAAFFGGVYSSLRGIRDGENTYKPVNHKTKEPASVAVTPRVPFLPRLLPTAGTPREQLAGWLVNPENINFSRVTVNRMWAVLFGRPLAEPVDDLPATGEVPEALDLLARDFSTSSYDLNRLIRVIAGSRVFRLESADHATAELADAREDAWATFPMTRLRPEQVAGALFQAASIPTLGAQSPWFVRLATYTGRNDFVSRYGDSGEDEFASCSGTIPQRLLLMNGVIVREKTGDGLFNASRRIAEQAPSDRQAVEVAYLTVLTREPSTEELAHFEGRLAGTTAQERKERVGDLFWTLFNSSEFSWNH